MAINAQVEQILGKTKEKLEVDCRLQVFTIGLGVTEFPIKVMFKNISCDI